MTITRTDILLAIANKDLEAFRRHIIEKEIAKKYTSGQEFRLYADKDTNPDTWNEHEYFVENVKAEVDSQINAILATL